MGFKFTTKQMPTGVVGFKPAAAKPPAPPAGCASSCIPCGDWKAKVKQIDQKLKWSTGQIGAYSGAIRGYTSQLSAVQRKFNKHNCGHWVKAV
eukprot:NODE_4077_length_362_cov_288.853035_g3495_i0.p2 GENE.NODE_4077_length_362_cov_288.853035_g3495_i0~~NODE_4077_length_362_cov_288.853035_g3495_i0.p2  ORF type:complete len:100 (-),score=29.53 NODE_4077_length_362_cov_288.853035_g3495_i0:62-340(-)